MIKTLLLAVPPDILDYPTSTDMVVREGSNVTLRCAASGSPEPVITWRRENGDPIALSTDVEGNRKETFFSLLSCVKNCTEYHIIRHLNTHH